MKGKSDSSEGNAHRAELVLEVRAKDEYALQGKIIYLLRTNKGWRQSDLAERLGVSKDTVHRIEKRGALDGVQLVKLAEIFGVGLEVFCGNRN